MSATCRRAFIAIVVSFCLVWCPSIADAQIDRRISYQGLLTQANGQPLADGDYELVFRMYDTQVAGNLLWEETQKVAITKGLFNVYLGSVVTLNTVNLQNVQVYLETAVAGQSPFSRTLIGVVPYAVRAERADSARSVDTTNLNVVRSINDMRGNLVIEGANGISITRSGDTLRLTSTVTFDAIKELTSPQNTLTIGNATGPAASLDVRDGAITTNKLAPGSVTSTIIADGTITTQHIIKGAVTSDRIASGVIPTTLPPSGPAGGELAGTYPNPLIANDVITTSKLRDAAVTTSKVADLSITSDKLSPTGVFAGVYGDSLNIPRLTIDSKGRITNVTQSPLVVTAGGDLTGLYPNPSIRVNAVTTAKILDASVTTPKIADGAVTNQKIADSSITTFKVRDYSLTIVDLAPGTIPTGLPPIGAAGGDLAGNYPAPILAVTSGAGSRMVDALRADFVAGDADINSATNLVMLDAQKRLPSSDGSLLTNLNASSITSGILGVQFGGTNSSTPLNNNRVMVSSGGRIVEAPQQTAGQLLIGTGSTTAPSVGSIQGGSGITVTYNSPNIVISSALSPGSVNDQTLRWDAATLTWLPNSNVLASSAGNLTVNGSVTAANLPMTDSTSGVLRRSSTGKIEVSRAVYATAESALTLNAALRTNDKGRIESIPLADGEVMIGMAGTKPQARRAMLDDLADVRVGGTGYEGSMFIGRKPANGAYNIQNSTVIGAGALRNITGGINNTVVGTSALEQATNPTWNSVVGSYTLANLQNGDGNTVMGAVSMNTMKNGSYQTAIGYGALYAFEGDANGYMLGGNVALGAMSGVQLIDGMQNVFLGSGSGSKIGHGNRSVAVGANALAGVGGLSFVYDDNVAIGSQSLFRVVGKENAAVGTNTLNNLDAGSGNVALGNGAGSNLYSGDRNIFIGWNSGPVLGAGYSVSDQLFIDNRATNQPLIKGDFAQRTLTINGAATLINGATTVSGTTSLPGIPTTASTTGVVRRAPSGQLEVSSAIFTTAQTALTANTALRTNANGQIVSVALNNSEVLTGVTGSAPVARTLVVNDLSDAAVDEVGNSITIGYKPRVGVMGQSTVLGIGALREATESSLNTAIGWNTLSSMKTGGRNTFIGADAGSQLLNSENSVAIGYTAMSIGVGTENNVAVGAFAQYYSNGRNNVAIGTSALQYNDGGNNNIGIGTRSMMITHGSFNIALGCDALQRADGLFNIAIGTNAMDQGLGESNIALGNEAMGTAQGRNNIGIGSRALSFAPGDLNIALGDDALINARGSNNIGFGQYAFGNGNGDYNIVIGSYSGFGVEGYSNVFIGHQSGYNLTSGSGNIFIGNQSGGTSTSMSNQLYIDNQLTDKPLIKGDFAERKIEFNGAVKHGKGVSYPIRIVSSPGINYTTDEDYTLIADTPCEIQLPSPVDYPGRMFIVKTRSGQTTISGIDVYNSQSITLTTPNDAVTLQSDGNEWEMISRTDNIYFTRTIELTPNWGDYHEITVADETVIIERWNEPHGFNWLVVPPPTTCKGKRITIAFRVTDMDRDSESMHRYGDLGSMRIDNAQYVIPSERSLFVLNVLPTYSATIQSDGNNWILISHSTGYSNR